MFMVVVIASIRTPSAADRVDLTVILQFQQKYQIFFHSYHQNMVAFTFMSQRFHLSFNVVIF